MTGRHRDDTFQPVAFLLACALPGLGHAYLNDLKRAALIFASIMGLFLGGILIGGIDVIDRTEDKWWFILQAGVGPTAFAANAVHQNLFKIEVRGPRGPVRQSPQPNPADNPNNQPPAARKSLGRVNEVGSLYTAMAGMLNLIAIIDAAWRSPAPRRRNQKGEQT
ncbi:MAG: hypothetical protein JNK58_09060 [Phycisphaerae bacterium]|nr:hypothetical protein [Phycisphaerae bacterium]